ncbi:two-component sensor histidine kinase [Actinomadura craniellae]|uniref:histidine kinase n=2 Tax=Actinomadura craniellae TaxID=2231787 RepID=A0A365H7H1_9ACTN|nr:two-component sensor histidine kinase [Actinomadura craniellae]
MYQQVDRSLQTAPLGRLDNRRADGLPPAWEECRSAPDQQPLRPLRYTTQSVTADGRGCWLAGPHALTVTGRDVRVARGLDRQALHDGTATDGTPMRVLTRTLHPPPGRAAEPVTISIAVPLDQLHRSLDSLALLLAALAGLCVTGAAVIGLLLGRAALRPIDRLTRVVEHIARTEDLRIRIPDSGDDEIARLSRSFNTMTVALAAARDRQQQLIIDAGHELRTPLTSLRGNIDLLLRADQEGRSLPAHTRATLLGDLKAQMLELTSLVDDLLELAPPGDPPPGDTVALHEVTRTALARARLRGPGLRFEQQLRPWYVHGDTAALERAVLNLLDNAIKFSPPGGTVTTRLSDGELTITDQGPGIADEDLPHVFDRFWRSPSARSLPGSGLGLSIVARAAHDTGGTIRLARPPDGGTTAHLSIPGGPAPDQARPAPGGGRPAR